VRDQRLRGFPRRARVEVVQCAGPQDPPRSHCRWCGDERSLAASDCFGEFSPPGRLAAHRDGVALAAWATRTAGNTDLERPGNVHSIWPQDRLYRASPRSCQCEDEAVAACRSILWAAAEASVVVAERCLAALGAKLGAIRCGLLRTSVDGCGRRLEIYGSRRLGIRVPPGVLMTIS